MTSRLLAGLVAGAAGATLLNAVTYLDMVVRARPSSTTREDTVRTVEEATGLSLADAGPNSDEADARRSGLGALLGIASGLATGAVYGLARPLLSGVAASVRGLLVGLAANVATTGPMAAAGVTDVREWNVDSWVSDLVPHLIYGLVTAAVADALTGHDRPRPAACRGLCSGVPGTDGGRSIRVRAGRKVRTLSVRPSRSEEAARWGAGIATGFAGISHLTFAREGFRAQVPDWVPIDADDTVLLSGAVEIALGLGLVVLPKERRRMAALLTTFLVAVFPGNISQYVNHVDGLGLDSDRKRPVRLLVEPLMWAVALHAGGLLRNRRASR